MEPEAAGAGGGVPRKRRNRWDAPGPAEAAPAEAVAGRRNRWAPAPAEPAPAPAPVLNASEHQLVETAAKSVAEGGDIVDAALRQNPTFAAAFDPASPLHAVYLQRLTLHRAVLEARSRVALPSLASVHTTPLGGVIMPSGGSIGRVFYPPADGGAAATAPRGQPPPPPEGGGFTAAPGGVGRVFYPPPDAYPPPEPAPPPADIASDRPRKRRSFRETAPLSRPNPAPPVPEIELEGDA
eukprot:scaffold10143_cov120-Isochrysis_galbana.AAC.10